MVYVRAFADTLFCVWNAGARGQVFLRIRPTGDEETEMQCFEMDGKNDVVFHEPNNKVNASINTNPRQ